MRLKEESLFEEQRRYSTCQVEIQIASVLMHAWAEVEHDLVYKPMSGSLSEDEYAILDEINGLVMAGEIALERLQRAASARISQPEKPFQNHYELSVFILDELKGKFSTDRPDVKLGRMDLLFETIYDSEINKPSTLKNFLDEIPGAEDPTGKPSVSDLVLEEIIEVDRSYYVKYIQMLMRANDEESLSAASLYMLSLAQEIIEFDKLIHDITARLKIKCKSKYLYSHIIELIKADFIPRDSVGDASVITGAKYDLIREPTGISLGLAILAKKKLRKLIGEIHTTLERKALSTKSGEKQVANALLGTHRDFFTATLSESQ